MKITKTKLKQFIKEELTKAQAEKKAELEDELEDLEHKWMKEGRLSSALQERYGIKNPVGKVLWHSLNESGEIGVYDMKFGDTIIRNLLTEDVEPEIVEGHEHSARREDDKDRLKWK